MSGQTITNAADFASDIIDRLIATGAMHRAQAATQKPALQAWLAERHGIQPPNALTLPCTVDRLTWGVTQYLEAPTTQDMDALRLLFRAELERFALAVRWEVGDRLRELLEAPGFSFSHHMSGGGWINACRVLGEELQGVPACK